MLHRARRAGPQAPEAAHRLHPPLVLDGHSVVDEVVEEGEHAPQPVARHLARHLRDLLARRLSVGCRLLDALLDQRLCRVGAGTQSLDDLVDVILLRGHGGVQVAPAGRQLGARLSGELVKGGAGRGASLLADLGARGKGGLAGRDERLLQDRCHDVSSLLRHRPQLVGGLLQHGLGGLEALLQLRDSRLDRLARLHAGRLEERAGGLDGGVEDRAGGLRDLVERLARVHLLSHQREDLLRSVDVLRSVDEAVHRHRRARAAHDGPATDRTGQLPGRGLRQQDQEERPCSVHHLRR
mmetsp:Transcript_58873/g.141226  ORF Transcript_58873/g.141226 Transcript_58873/m.141226 type:complete len:296 (-) Transcript_58873:35-922(-)